MDQSIFESPLFILGLQRSGTTWLTNIFDSSPDTLLFFEPFAPKYNLFEHFPHEFFYVDSPSPFLSNLLKENIPNLINYKSVLFRRGDINHFAFNTERILMHAILKFDRIFRSSRLQFAHQYQLLNLNRFNDKDLFFQKNKVCKQLVIKELRLGGKVKLIKDTYPDARFILIVRHPVAVVHSMLTWIKKGHLGELRSGINIYFECIENQTVYQPYLDKINYCRNKDMTYKLALFWLINTEIALSQLKDYKNARIVIYENLAKNPLRVVQELYDFLELDVESQVENYLEKSTTQASPKTGIIETVRQSKTYYAKWQNQVSKPTQQAVLEIVEGNGLLPEIEKNYV